MTMNANSQIMIQNIVSIFQLLHSFIFVVDTEAEAEAEAMSQGGFIFD